MIRIFGIILIGLICVAAFAGELKVGMKAPDFILQDAEDKDYKLKEMKGNVIVLIMGNRKTRKGTDKWGMSIGKNYRKNKKLKTFIIADMRGIPWFIPKSFIKGQLKKDKPPATLLLDWGGKTHIAYKTRKKEPNIFIISKLGKIAFRLNANYDDKVFKKLNAEIKKALEGISRS